MIDIRWLRLGMKAHYYNIRQSLLFLLLFIFIYNMSIHEKMQSDYLWVRHAPVEEGVKVRYAIVHLETTAIISCTTAPPTVSKD